MDISILTLNGIPRPARSRFGRRGDFRCIIQRETALPAGFPDGIQPEKMLKESGSVGAFVCGNGNFFGKLLKFKSWKRSFGRIFQVPRVFRAFSGGEALLNAGFTTPRPAAAAVCFRFGVVPVTQLLLTELLPEDTVFLDNLVKTHSAGQAENILAELAEFLASLHRNGLIHGDASLRNFYLLPHGKGFGMIDLDGICVCHGLPPKHARARELARMVSSFVRCSPFPLPPSGELLAQAVKTYVLAGGEAIPEDMLLPPFRRFMKHKDHPLWQGESIVQPPGSGNNPS